MDYDEDDKNGDLDGLKYYLKEMFQFSNNDLDFGIFKIYNLKNKEISEYIDKKLQQDINNTIGKVKNNINENSSIKLKSF